MTLATKNRTSEGIAANVLHIWPITGSGSLPNFETCILEKPSALSYADARGSRMARLACSAALLLDSSTLMLHRSAQDPPSSGKDKGMDEPYPPYDRLLMMFVGVIDKWDLELPVTLNVGGVIITGGMISSRKYAARLEKMFAEGESMAPQFTSAFQQMQEPPTPEETESPEIPEPTHLHLTDAEVLLGGTVGNIAFGDKGLWRFRVERVDGFMSVSYTHLRAHETD